MNKKISDKDKQDWQSFIDSNDKLFDKDYKLTKDKQFKSRQLDLHGYSLDDANQKIKYFIISSYEEGVRKLRIVTGKGLHSDNEKNPYVSKDLSILKYSIPEYINNNPSLMKLINSLVKLK